MFNLVYFDICTFVLLHLFVVVASPLSYRHCRFIETIDFFFDNQCLSSSGRGAEEPAGNREEEPGSESKPEDGVCQKAV